MTPLRIGLAQLHHESNSFTRGATTLAQFSAEAYHRGTDILAVYRGTDTELGGALSILDRPGVQVVPLLAASATPFGEIADATYATLVGELRQQVREALQDGPLDGLVISMHGSMVAENEKDPEGSTLGWLSERLGPRCPIAATFDLHANMSTRAVDANTMIFGYQTYPHVDMREQGARAATAVLDAAGGRQLYVAFTRLPMHLPSINMRTAVGPMADVVAFARSLEERPGIVAASPHAGFPYADTPCSGASVSIVAESAGDAEAACRDLATTFWNARDRFWIDMPPVSAALQRAQAAVMRGHTPVVLADVADNPQSGGGGDSTGLIREAVAFGLPRMLVSAFCAGGAVAGARRAGVGAHVECCLGDDLDVRFGAALDVEATVLATSDGVYVNEGPFNRGLEVDTLGAAALRVRRVAGLLTRPSGGNAEGIFDIVVTGRPLTANDPGLYHALSVDFHRYDVLLWKVKNHFRAAFGSEVAEVIPVDGYGPALTDFTSHRYRYSNTTFWPFDRTRARGDLDVRVAASAQGEPPLTNYQV